ncbi:MAG TPA: hypothetical protein VF881_10480 [Polyangiaceae bacterium]
MGAADSVRHRHLELLELASETIPLLDADHLRRDCFKARLKLLAWANAVRLHLDLENRSVYARLWPHCDPMVITKALRFQRELRALADRVTDYADQWLLANDAIASSPNEFIEETNFVFELFSGRLQLEDEVRHSYGSGSFPAAAATGTDGWSSFGRS